MSHCQFILHNSHKELPGFETRFYLSSQVSYIKKQRKIYARVPQILCFIPQKCIDVTLLKSTGHLMHQQFNIQQLYVLPTLYLCVLYLSENKQRLVPLTA